MKSAYFGNVNVKNYFFKRKTFYASSDEEWFKMLTFTDIC